jgi:hypothetical protein
MEFQVKLTENLISKYHITEDRPLGRPPETAPLTRLNAPHYPQYCCHSVKAKSASALCYAQQKGSML